MMPGIAEVLLPALLSFLVGLTITPILTRFLYEKKAWKKRGGKRALNGETAHEFNRLHTLNEVRVPRMGGVVIWGSVFLTTVGLTILAALVPRSGFLQELDFLSRSQTWLPLATLMVGALAGLVDDLLIIRPVGGDGLRLRYRLIIVIALSLFVGWWFWAKLGVTAIDIPFSSPLYLGSMIVPLFILISLGLYASGVIDGIDGLSGGVFAVVFASYAIIAFAQHQTDLSAFCAVVVGGLLAFLWFNIPPARFYMSDTGTFALTLAVPTIAFLTDNLSGGVGIAVLPLIGGLLVITVLSDVVQVIAKNFFGRKVLRIAPLHHHFEAIGWPPYKVVMRYWIFAIVLAALGVIVALAAIQ
jgi:phospho-N-acetylmuramoyl-pentapeptide-transferase